MNKKIAVTTSTFAEHDKSVVKECRKAGYTVIFNPYRRTLKPEEFISLVDGTVGVIAGTEIITQAMLSRLPQLKVISRCGAGLDNVDIQAAKKLGIHVFNTPDAPTRAVAELTVGLMLGLMRKIPQMDKDLKRGSWNKKMGLLLCGKNVGIIGFGRIGRKVSGLLKGFGCQIAYHDPFVKEKITGAKRLSLKKLLAWADIVSLHVSANKLILGKKELQAIKKGAYLINTSRGAVLEESALCVLLKTGHIAAAALDVFANEPYKGCLQELENVILTPHIGSYAKESRTMMEKEAVFNLLRGLREGASL